MKKFLKWCLWIAIMFIVGFGIFMAGKLLNPKVVYEQKEVVKEIETVSPGAKCDLI